ncbi:glutamate-rich WD repeat-containing protein 1-like [Portunus trituberculatus]|uniref:glutamate-rich WD repeat-containing protein 1-like n=1 Tax=Portunus trituberculatus TaxID=210409 RepID=UPI001E1CDB60|nr:glutamate-rich WD repeat-containing protein 1-like [Portunus trituberculatus]
MSEPRVCVYLLPARAPHTHLHISFNSHPLGAVRSMEEGQEERMEEEEAMEGGSEEEGEEGGGGKGEGLECDFSAYKLFHEGSTGAPCLSFDILRDSLGEDRTCDRPVTLYFVAGTQAARVHLNTVLLMKVSQLSRLKEGESESESELEDEEDEGREPQIASAAFKHNGGVNRIRATTINNVPIAAVWSELGQVSVWELTPLLEEVDAGHVGSDQGRDEPPLFTFRGHRSEGFALDWSPVKPGTLATGDCQRAIYIWRPQEGARWQVGGAPLAGHTASVEDLQWSPSEASVLASCSVDRSIRVWDVRAPPNKACMITSDAHPTDINVLHWNHCEPFLASGGDDGCVRVWDLRNMQGGGGAVAELKHHTAPVTTVEWHSSEGSVLASGGEDDAILQWDLAVEREAPEEEEEETPEQLLFVHRGQQEVKELHWHPQIPGLVVSTAHTGFNVFKTISC